MKKLFFLMPFCLLTTACKPTITKTHGYLSYNGTYQDDNTTYNIYPDIEHKRKTLDSLFKIANTPDNHTIHVRVDLENNVLSYRLSHITLVKDPSK